MELFDALARRYSYRGPFRAQPVPRADLRRIVEAGLQAPSGKNGQTTRFIIVDDAELLKQIGRLHASNTAVQQARAMIACLAGR